LHVFSSFLHGGNSGWAEQVSTRSCVRLKGRCNQISDQVYSIYGRCVSCSSMLQWSLCGDCWCYYQLHQISISDMYTVADRPPGLLSSLHRIKPNSLTEHQARLHRTCTCTCIHQVWVIRTRPLKDNTKIAERKGVLALYSTNPVLMSYSGTTSTCRPTTSTCVIFFLKNFPKPITFPDLYGRCASQQR
jgi:hypothetical protein